jgi:hypothetical protein
MGEGKFVQTICILRKGKPKKQEGMRTKLERQM